MKTTNSRIFSPLAVLLVSAPIAACSASDAESASNGGALAAENTSAYTPLHDFSECVHYVQTGDGPAIPGLGPTSFLCKRMGEYQLFATTWDGRQNVVLGSSRGFLDLDVWSQMPAPGYLGPKAEWRGTFVAPGKVNPSALIFRYIQPTPDQPNRSHLLVAKITPDDACIYAVVDGNEAGGNETARIEADKAASIACPPKPVGVRTRLDPHDCGESTLSAGESSPTCAGVGQYQLVVHHGDSASVSVRSALGESHLSLMGIMASVTPYVRWRKVPNESDPYAVVFRYV